MMARDSFFNLIATIAFIGSQQLIIFRHISNISEEIFSEAILLVTFINVYSYITSGALGRTMLMRHNKYPHSNRIPFDFTIFLIVFFAITLLIMIGTYLFTRDLLMALFTFFLIILVLIRTFYSCRKKLKREFIIVMYQNLFYFFGCVITCFYLDKLTNNYMLYFLIPEIFSSLIYILDKKEFLFERTLTNNFSTTKHTFINFSFQTLMNNTISYFDRFLVVPILGSEALALYFSATVLSKCSLLLVGPVSEVIATMLANTSDGAKVKVFNYLNYKTKRLFLIVFVANLILSYGCMYFIYRKYFYDGILIVAIMSLSVTLVIFSDLYQVACMRFLESSIITYISFIRVVIACVCAFLLSKIYGVNGYSAGIALSNLVSFVTFIVIAYIITNNRSKAFL